MLTKKMSDELNKQLNEELYSSYLYLAMSAYFSSISLKGFANWMNIQSQEENIHAMKFYNYILERGEKVQLDTINKPETNWESIIKIFEATLDHERHITGRINHLANVALEEKDHATLNFLQWFISEQVEEEANVSEMLDKLKLIGGEGNALFMLDNEAAQRILPPQTPTN